LRINIALPHFSARRSFVAGNQPVAAAMPSAHDLRENNSVIRPATGFDARAYCVNVTLP